MCDIRKADYKELPEQNMDLCTRIMYEVGGIFYAPLAQMGEHSTFNRVAMGPRSTLRSGPCWTWSTGPQRPMGSYGSLV